jgi:uncharacterized oligopeptide transporter (OPT) family protein
MRLPLPKIGSVGYYLLLGAVAIFILGPLGGIAAAYMNFAVGTFVGGQVLAGILGSVVTLGYGPEGKHGANYMQTLAASVAGMGAMSVLVQAMVWLGMPLPPVWQLVLFFLCIGMFGVGVGMLYTPILVDKLQLVYPSGLAVANILRALTDIRLLKKSVTNLGSSIVGGGVLSALVEHVPALGATAYSSAVFGGGMIVGARVTLSTIFVGGIGLLLSPWLRTNGYLGENDPFRKIGFVFALGTILGAAVVDLSLLAVDALKTIRKAKDNAVSGTEKTKMGRLLAWIGFWALALTVVATQIFNVPIHWALFAIAMSFVFQMINGISQGMTDQNPISSAFVVTVLLMSLLGLRDPLLGLFGGSILLVSCTVGVDMQQDRSTGWRLGSDRAIQFRFQVVGVIMGALIAVFMSRVFLEAYPVLKENQLNNPALREGAAKAWQSAMTYKFVGILNTLAQDKSKTLSVMGLGIVIGFAIEVIRKWLFKHPAYLSWKNSSLSAKSIDFTLDAVLLASPYASSFGGFVEFTSTLWWGLGGVVHSVLNTLLKKLAPKKTEDDLPEDMSTVSLVGGGLIAGESLWVLYSGLAGLVASGALWRIFGL